MACAVGHAPSHLMMTKDKSYVSSKSTRHHMSSTGLFGPSAHNEFKSASLAFAIGVSLAPAVAGLFKARLALIVLTTT